MAVAVVDAAAFVLRLLAVAAGDVAAVDTAQVEEQARTDTLALEQKFEPFVFEAPVPWLDS